MTIIKYRTSHYDIDIEVTEAIRETKHCIFIPPTKYFRRTRRATKRGTYDIYHDTWAEARDHLLQREEEKKASLLASLKRVENNIKTIKDMTEPV